MESLKPKDKIYCQTRKEWLEATPEEKIRQGLLHHLADSLGYPASCILVEKALHQMPHLDLKREKFPLRRADIVCFSPDVLPQSGLYPLLLIECKAVKITQKMVSQVIGYNHFLKACYISVANGNEVLTGRWDNNRQTYVFINFLPKYIDLIRQAPKDPAFGR